MESNVVRFLAVFFVALALVPAGAHLIELPNKITLSAEAYRIVQEIYRGWAYSGILVIAALLCTLALCIVERHTPAFGPAVLAFLCLVATQIIFWSVTFPVNRATDNWAMLPDIWEQLRMRWEYSHATSSIFNLAALVAVISSALLRRA